MADDFATDGAVTVDNPAVGAVTELNPTKLMFVTAVPTELPPNSSSTPEITPVKFAPDPTNDVAVTTPANSFSLTSCSNRSTNTRSTKLNTRFCSNNTNRVNIGYIFIC